jgi:hypothetical protein
MAMMSGPMARKDMLVVVASLAAFLAAQLSDCSAAAGGGRLFKSPSLGVLVALHF